MIEIKHEIDNTYIHYVKFGEGSKNLVIVSGVSLCGFEGLGAAIAKQDEVLAKNFTCYVFDRKTKLEVGCAIDDLADDLYRVLKEIGVDRAYFVGISQGGMISLSMAINHPDMVEKLVVASSAAWSGPISRETWAEARCYLNAEDIYNFNMHLYQRIYSNSFLEQNARALDRLAHNGTKEQCERFIILADSMDAFDVRKDLQKIKCPCFVIGGKLDKVFGFEASEEIAKALNCECFIYENQAHALYDESPDFCERVLNFFK